MKPIIIISSLLTLLYSCKREAVESQLQIESVCLVDTVYRNNGYEALFYNSNHKVIKAIVVNGSSSYVQHIAYDGSLVTVTVEGEPGKQLIWLNAFGYADSIFSNIGVQGQFAYRFKYNDKQQLLYQHHYGYTSTFNWNTQSFFEYANGNLIRKYIPRDIDTFYTDYSYDLTKENTLHTYEQLLQYLPTNKNLLIGIKTHPDGTETDYTFLFDAAGRVVKRTSGNAVGTFGEEEFIWNCK